MTVFLTALHVLACLLLIAVVLLQRGKGADIGAVFGSGSSTTVFGARGAGTFLTKLTTGAAAIFMLTSLVLSYYATRSVGESLFEEETLVGEEEAAGEPLFQEFGTAPAQGADAETPAAD